MKYLLILICLSCSTAVFGGRIVHGESRISLNGYWKFQTDPLDKGEAERWYAVGYSDKSWDKLAVPGSWDLHNEYSKYNGKAWYRHHFTTPKDIGDKRVLIEFGAVSMGYKVYVNNVQLADILVGNYTEQIDVTDVLSSDGDNVISVVVDNSLRWGAYFNWGGIRRPVHLLVREPVSVARQQIVAKPDLKKGTTTIEIEVFLRNDEKEPREVTCQPEIYFGGKLIKKALPVSVVVPAGSETSRLFKINLSRKETTLWHFDHPNLYTSIVKLRHDQQLLFARQDRFGIRKLELDGYQFKLNGEPVRLAGYNWVAEDRTTGNSLPAWRYKEDIDRMKAAGANMARLSHRPLPEEVMDYLDEKGIMVVAEINNWSAYLYENNEESKEFLLKLVRQNYNHPSVIGWSIGNEMANYKENPDVKGYVKSMITYVKEELDPNRFVLYVSNTADWQKDDPAQFCDFIMINKYLTPDGKFQNFLNGLDSLHAWYPEKPIFLSEYGGYGYTIIYDTPDKSTMKDIIVDKLSGRPYLFGFSLWTFNDYRSIYRSHWPTSNTPLHENRQWGIVDVYRNKKRSFHQMRKAYAPVKQLSVSDVVHNGKLTASVVTITPRQKLDIPAYIMNGYKLVWEIRDKLGQIQQMDFENLPTINPGDETTEYRITWNDVKDVSSLKVALLSPTGYDVLDTTVYYLPPPPPKIRDVIQAGTGVRIIIDNPLPDREYILKYGIGGYTQSTRSSINHYIEVTNLEAGKPYQFALAAVNGAGESELSAPVTAKPQYGYKGLPPVIWLTEPCDSGFYVGTSVDLFDIFYEVEYGKSFDDERGLKRIKVTNFGMFQVPGLNNNEKYYYRVRRFLQGALKSSKWSEIREVIPNAHPLVGKPSVNGLVKRDGELLLSCSTAKNANGYVVKIHRDGTIKEFPVNQSEFNYIVLNGVKDDVDISEVSIHAL